MIHALVRSQFCLTSVVSSLPLSQNPDDGGAELTGHLWGAAWTLVFHLWPDGLGGTQVWVGGEADSVVCGSWRPRTQVSWPLPVPADVHPGMSTGRLWLAPNPRFWYSEQTTKGFYPFLPQSVNLRPSLPGRSLITFAFRFHHARRRQISRGCRESRVTGSVNVVSLEYTDVKFPFRMCQRFTPLQFDTTYI